MTTVPVTKQMDGIGERLQRLRVVFNLIQKELAAEIRVSSNRLSQWESDKHPPALDAAINLRRKYGITLDWLYFGDPRGMTAELLRALLAAKLPAPAGRRRAKKPAGDASAVPFRERVRK